MIKVAIVDDEPFSINALSRYLEPIEDIQVSIKASSGTQLLEAIPTHQVDVVLADIHMPHMSGLDLLHEVKRLPEPPAFLAITAIDRGKTLKSIIEAGGQGYILKSQSPESIAQAIRDSLADGLVIAPQINATLYRKATKTSPQENRNETLLDLILAPSSTLASVDKEIIALLCKGTSNANIADQLGYSESGIKKRVSKLFKQFSVQSKAALIAKLLELRES